MGFSVSGATVVIAIGMLIGFGMAFGVADDSLDRVASARDDRTDRWLDRQNTDIEVTNATFNDTSKRLTVSVGNIGSAPLAIDMTTVLVEGEYLEPTSSRVDGDGETNLWLPGDTLDIEIENVSDRPTRLVVVTENGVSVATETIGGT